MSHKSHKSRMSHVTHTHTHTQHHSITAQQHNSTQHTAHSTQHTNAQTPHTQTQTHTHTHTHTQALHTSRPHHLYYAPCSLRPQVYPYSLMADEAQVGMIEECMSRFKIATTDTALTLARTVSPHAADSGKYLALASDPTLPSLLQDLALGKDSCIVGQKGCGKSALVRHIAQLTGYSGVTYTVHLFKDMTSRGKNTPFSLPFHSNSKTETNHTPT